jgi:hypothetical protein
LVNPYTLSKHSKLGLLPKLGIQFPQKEKKENFGTLPTGNEISYQTAESIDIIEL